MLRASQFTLDSEALKNKNLSAITKHLLKFNLITNYVIRTLGQCGSGK